MKKIYALIIAICFFACSHAQYVTIPDPIFALAIYNDGFGQCFKSGSTVLLDTTCFDVINAKVLDVSLQGNLFDITGIQYFKNLDTFYCYSTGIVNMGPLPNTLRVLYCGGYLDSITSFPPNLTTLYVSGGPLTKIPPYPNSLTDLTIQQTTLTTLPSLPPALKRFSCGGNYINTIPSLPSTLTYLECGGNFALTSLPTLPASLTYLGCSDCVLPSLPTLPASLLMLNCGLNYLTTLPLLPPTLKDLSCNDMYIAMSALPTLPATLKFLDCGNDSLHSLPATPAGLDTLRCGYNFLTALPPLGDSLAILYCSNNQLTFIPALPPSVKKFDCSYNNLTGLPPLPSGLNLFYCSSNLLTSLPALPDSMADFTCANNPSLYCLPPLKQVTHSISIFNTGITCLPNVIKHPGYYAILDTLPICNLLNANNCQIAWNIEGAIYNDENSDCMQQPGEQMIFPVKMNLYQAGNLVQSEYAEGMYSFKTGFSSYTVSMDTTGLPFYADCFTDTALNISAADSLRYNINFGLHCKPGYDIAVQSIAAVGFRQAAVTPVNISAGDLSKFYNGHCAGGVGGTATVTITGPVQYISAAPGALQPTSVVGKVITWNIADWSAVDFTSSFNLITRSDTAIMPNDEVCFWFTVTPISGDYDTANNTLTQCFPVRTSFDPNGKDVSPTGEIAANTPWLTYTIHFQNTGTDTARNIYLADTLSPYVDVSSFQLLASSNKNITQVFLDNRMVIFNFPGINLPDSTTNSSRSTGYIQYRVKPLNNLSPGTTLHNTAYIYFDFNPPVATNDAANTVAIPTDLKNTSLSNITIYPNPTKSSWQLAVGKELIDAKLDMYNIEGQLLFQSQIRNQQSEISVPGLSSGVYFIRLSTGNEVQTVKVVKE